MSSYFQVNSNVLAILTSEVSVSFSGCRSCIFSVWCQQCASRVRQRQEPRLGYRLLSTTAASSLVWSRARRSHPYLLLLSLMRLAANFFRQPTIDSRYATDRPTVRSSRCDRLAAAMRSLRALTKTRDIVPRCWTVTISADGRFNDQLTSQLSADVIMFHYITIQTGRQH